MAFYFCLIITLTITIVFQSANDYIIGKWALSQDQNSNFAYYGGLSLAFALGAGIGVFLRAGTVWIFTIRATRKLHEQMISSIINAPVNLYFDITPIGRIMNKFSKDLTNIETNQAPWMGITCNNIFLLVQVLAIAIYAVKYVAFTLPFVIIMSYFIVRRAACALKESVKLTSTTKSPLLSYLGESISGSSTIRAYKRQHDFIRGYQALLDQNILSS